MLFSRVTALVISLLLCMSNSLVTFPPAAGIDSHQGRNRYEKHSDNFHNRNIKRGKELESEGFRGMRCGPALFTASDLQGAASKACELIRRKKKTWGFTRYPLSYQPNFDEIKIPLMTDEEKKPVGPYFLYPILRSGKVFRFGRTGPYRIIVSKECQVVGTVTKIRSRTKCEGFKCWNPFRLWHHIYSTCFVDRFL